MNNVNITEKYTLCMLKEKKMLYENELTPHLIVSMMIEMMLDGNLEITDKNKVKLNEKLPISNYNKNLYEIMKDLKKEEIPLKNIITSICYTLPNKKLQSVIEALKEGMLEKELIVIENKKGLLGNKEKIQIKENKFINVIEEIRSEVLEKGKLTEDLILLTSLLNSTKFLKNIFTKYEKDELNNRLNEIKNTQISKKVKVAQSVISDMSALTASILLTSLN